VNNWLVVGRNSATANGTLILNSGTITKTGGGNVVVGSLGATGLLVVNGGQLFNNANLWLGENGTANGTLMLNGGLLQATQIRIQGATPASSTAYFNGGILQASGASADFIAAPTVPVIQAGGLVLDNNGFDLTIASVLVEDTVTPSTGGGLTKLGAGTLTLSGVNTYPGPTIVSNGTLRVDGNLVGVVTVKSGAALRGGGTIGAISIEAGGEVSAGASIGTLIVGSASLSGAVVAEVDRNGGTPLADLITVSTPVSYAGTLVLRNIGAPLQVNDTFTVFNAPNYSGSFTIVSQTAGQSVTWDTSNLLVNGTVRVASAGTVPFSLVAGASGNILALSWSPSQLGLRLETNAVDVADMVSWFTYPGSTNVTNVNIVINPSRTNVFFRLANP